MKKYKIILVALLFSTSVALSQVKVEYYTTLGLTRNVVHTPNTDGSYILSRNFNQPKTGLKLGLGANIILNDYMKIGTGFFLINRRSTTADSILLYSFDFLVTYPPQKAKVYIFNAVANFTSIEVPVNIFIKLFSIKNIETQLKIGLWGGYLAKWDMKIDDVTIFSYPPSDEIKYLYSLLNKSRNDSIVAFNKATAGAIIGLNCRYKKLDIDLEYNYMHNNLELNSGGNSGSLGISNAVIRNKTLSLSAQYFF